MKHIAIIILILLLSASTQVNYSQQTNGDILSIDDFKTEPVSVGYSLKFHSNILNEDRVVMVSLPDDYNSTIK